jgi:GTP-binding protein
MLAARAVAAPMRRRLLSVDAKAFCDRLRLRARGGRGGRGAVAWDVTNRSRGRKPAGGSGGTGGDVIVRVAPHKDALDSTRRFAVGEDGTNGGPSMRRGRDGPPTYVDVPPHTAVNGTVLHRPGEELIVARGTRGSPGNGVYRGQGAFGLTASAAPSDVVVDLEMTLAADVALVGSPNAGKSSLLKALSRAEPKVAPYPFTTTRPVIGVVEFENESELDVVRVLDVPGLLEGAASGKGLGDDFLRHVARCASALHVVDASADDPVGDLETVRVEIERFGLNELPFRVLLSKSDLVTSERLSELEGALSSYNVSVASTTSGAGLGEAALQIRRLARAVATPRGPSDGRVDGVEATRSHEDGAGRRRPTL